MKKSIEKQVQELKDNYGVDCFNFDLEVFNKLGIYLGKQKDNIVFITRQGILPSGFKIKNGFTPELLDFNLEICLEAINYLFSNVQKIANSKLLKEPSQEERYQCIISMLYKINSLFALYKRRGY